MIPVDESEYLPPLVLQQVVLEAGNVSPLPPRQIDRQIDIQIDKIDRQIEISR